MSVLQIEESFDVPAAPDEVFAFLLDPEQLVGCMPGATLDEIETDRVFRGSVQVKVGTVRMTYQGLIELTRVDEHDHVLEAKGEGREKGGAGKVRVELTVAVAQAGRDASRVAITANVKLAGKIVRFGRGLIEAVSKELFGDFAEAVAARVPETSDSDEPTSESPDATPIRALPLLWRSIRSWLRRLFGAAE